METKTQDYSFEKSDHETVEDYLQRNSPSTIVLNKHSEIHHRGHSRRSIFKDSNDSLSNVNGLLHESISSPSTSVTPRARRSSLLITEGSPARVNLDISDTPAEVTSTRIRDLAIFRCLRWIFSIDGIVSIAFLCDTMTLALPVILVPIAIEEEATKKFESESIASVLIAAKVAHISSMAFMGGAVGKLINGFICVELGSYTCSRRYLAGMAFCSLLFSFSTNATMMGLTWAGLEFFSSVQYSSLAVLLSDYYSSDPVKLASALTVLGLACTVGDILAKVVGTVLSSTLHWRAVARIGACVAMTGCVAISQAPGRHTAEELHNNNREPFHLSSVARSLKAVLGGPLFWKIAIPYSMAFTACYADRILVPFYNEMTNLPHSICGGLTLSITFGLIHGLVTGSNKYTQLQTVRQKKVFLKNRYVGNVAATLGLAALSYYGQTLIGNNVLLAVLAFFLSAMMASTVSFQVFQLPAIIAQKYGDHQAVCISFLDGFGYLFSIPVFSVLGTLVPRHGWESGWGLLAVLFSLGGIALVSSIGPVLKGTDLYTEEEEEDLKAVSFFHFEWASRLYCAKGYILCTDRRNRAAISSPRH